MEQDEHIKRTNEVIQEMQHHNSLLGQINSLLHVIQKQDRLITTLLILIVLLTIGDVIDNHIVKAKLRKERRENIEQIEMLLRDVR